MTRTLMLDATRDLTLAEFIGYLSVVLANDVPEHARDTARFAIGPGFAYNATWSVVWEESSGDPIQPA